MTLLTAGLLPSFLIFSQNELGQLAEDIRNTTEALNLYVTEVKKGLSALGRGKLNYHSEVEFKGVLLRWEKR